MPAARPHLDSHLVARMARVGAATPAQLEIELNERDRDRVARFRFPEDRACFVLGRVLLGKLLRHFLRHPAGVVELDCTPQGRPFLRHHPAVQFSITHSRDLVAVALATGTQVGIDIQHRASNFRPDQLAERIFSEGDLEKFRALPGRDAAAAFFRAWTGKEAVLKARGVGLFGGLKEVSIPFHGEDSNQTIRVAGQENTLRDWCLQSLPVPPDYSGHIAWDDRNKKTDFREMKMDEDP